MPLPQSTCNGDLECRIQRGPAARTELELSLIVVLSLWTRQRSGLNNNNVVDFRQRQGDGQRRFLAGGKLEL